jgi:Ser/Thr protein kinase RdoA (MazF antagonist)
VAFEVAALRHLGARGAPVSVPVPRRDGGLVGVLHAPEGPRRAVLFSWAEGVPVPLDPENAERLGRATALLHAAAEGFTTSIPRASLDLGGLLDGPLRTLAPFLATRPEDARFLTGLARRLQRWVEACAGVLEWGLIHGDLHPGNAHVAADGRVTLFDFEMTACGWRADDLATFRLSAEMDPRVDVQPVWAAFLRGYTTTRSLPDRDVGAVPLFVALRQIWLLGQQAAATPIIGLELLDGRRISRALSFLRSWEQEHLSDGRPV